MAVVITIEFKRITEDQIEWYYDALPEDTPIKGAFASGDDEQDKEQEELIRSQLDSGNEWAWCTVRVRGRYKSIQADEYLGCCSYLSEDDFMQCPYCDDMRDEVCSRINAGLIDRVRAALMDIGAEDIEITPLP